MQFFRITSLVVILAVFKTEAFPTLDAIGKTDLLVENNSAGNIDSVNEKMILKRQVVPGATGPGQYGGTWNSKDGKTQAKAGVDFNNAPKLGWHADVQREIHRSNDGKVRTEVFGGANQQFNQVGRSPPNVQGGIRVHFRR